MLVYFPFVHMVWGGGLLSEIGVIDYARGIVVHITAGMSALASVFYVGRRNVKPSEPHNIPLVAIGAALIWYGFNAGGQLRADGITALVFLNTDIAASFGAITWMIIEWVDTGKPKLIELLIGALGGLVTITPAAGYVSINVAVLMGVLSAFACYGAIKLKNKLEWDDALDVWGIHSVGGVLGVVCLALFSSTKINSTGADGLIFGGTQFFLVEIGALMFASVYAFVISYVLLNVINNVTPVRVDDETQSYSLDSTLHGEQAYYAG